MLHKENRKLILELFFDFPTKRFQLRQISRETKIAVTSVKRYLDRMLKERLVIKENNGIYPYFIANRENDLFKFYKKLSVVERLKVLGILDYLEDNCLPRSIILFGSASLGEDIENGDVDLFVQCKEVKIDLKLFERKLNRKINIFFEDDFSRLSKELKNNILNGIKLYGYVEVFK